MFNDRYGLTQSVLNATKTMTRRICKEQHWSFSDLIAAKNGIFHFEKPKYKIGEIVAIAQSYKDAGFPRDTIQRGRCVRQGKGHLSTWDDSYISILGDWYIDQLAGWSNKMYVHAELMPHRIRITDIKVERLQEISDEDCIKEGISEMYDAWYEPQVMETVVGSNVAFVDPFGFDDEHNEIFRNYPTPREAFAALIDRVSGKGTWKSNPWVFAYTFELVKGGKE